MCRLKLVGEIFVLMGKMFYVAYFIYSPYCYNIFNVRDCLLDFFLKMREGLCVNYFFLKFGGGKFVLMGKICSEVE